MNSVRRWHGLAPWAVVGLLLLAFALRLYALDVRELGFDEVGSVFIASRGPLGLLAYLRGAIREHPPLYYLLLSIWMPLAGRSELAVRFLSVGIGLATVAATYRLVGKMTRPSVALWTTLLLGLSPFHIRASQDTRMYGLLALWSLLSIFFFVRLLSQDRARWWWLFWLVTGLGMSTHYYMGFVLLAEDLFLLLNWRRLRHLWVRWLAIHVVMGGAVALWAVLSPGLWATLLSFWRRGTASHVRWESLARALNGLYLGATLRPNWRYLALPLALTALGVGVAAQASPWLSRGQRNGQAGPTPVGDVLLGLLLGVPIVTVMSLPERVTGRYLAAALPACALAMGLALDWLARWLVDGPFSQRGTWSPAVRRLSLAVGCASFALLLGWIVFVDLRAYPLVYFPPTESFRDRVEYVQAHARPDDGLLLHGPWQALLLTYYSAGSLKHYTVPLEDLGVAGGVAETTLAQIFDAHERVWVSYSSVEPVDPDWVVARWLNEHAHQVWSEGSLALYYAAPAQVLPPALANPPLTENSGGQAKAPLPFRTFLPLTAHNLDAGAQAGYERAARTDVRFGGKLQLEGVALANVEPAVGEAVLLLTKWRALQDIPHGLVVQLELIDPAGEMWGEYQFRIGPAHSHTRGWSASETFVERRGLVIPVGTPPGDYVLRVRVCRPHGYDCDEWPLQGADAFEVGPFRVSGSVASTALAALPGHDLHVTFEDTLALVGYEPWGSSFTQGNPLFFNLYWQALVYPPEDYEVGIELVDRDAAVLVERRAQPVADWFPTSHWRAGDVLLGRYALPLPLDAPPGRYQIRLSVYTPDGAPLAVGGTREVKVLDWWCREQAISGTDVSLFEVQIEARPRLYRPPAMDHRVDAVLGDDVRLLGYDLAAASVRPGDSVKLTLYWQALRRIERMYAVFCHLVDPAGTVVTQADGWPQEGAYPTLQWLPGEVVEDSYTIPLPPDARAGEYTLLVGMYDAETGERPATMVDGTLVPERYVTLTTITVEE